MDLHHAQIIASNDGSISGEFAIKEKLLSTSHHDHSSSESAHHHMQQEAQHKFFWKIGEHLQQFDEIFIFGPGKAQEALFNYLAADKHFRSKKMSIDSAAHMTENQMVAKVRDHFKH